MDPAEVPVGEQVTGNVSNPGRRKRLLAGAYAAAAIAIVASTTAAIAVRQHQQAVLASHRPSGIPASIPDRTVSLMGLSPVPATAAPGFQLTDQDGRTLPLSAFRGKVVVLEFMDPHCTDICPLVSQEYLDAYYDLGRGAGNVIFGAVNVNQYHDRVQDVLAYSREHQLITIPNWHFFTGPARVLQAVWRSYDVEVEAPNPDADIVHTSVIYFIGPGGTERYVATPMADHTSSGTSYLPASQITAWGHGIAQIAETLTR